MSVVEVHRGTLPLVLAFPHTGTFVPPDILSRLNSEGRKLRDTDWHVHRLYEGLVPGASVVRAWFHRYVIDANRDPSGKSLYPGQNTTGLVPLVDFDNRAIWQTGAAPGAGEIAERLERFHRPYHAALLGELERVRDRHGYVILYDCHSIRSPLPFLFQGALPDLNVGDNGGHTCSPAVRGAVMDVCAGQNRFSYVLNGRFKGGWTVRHYGRPGQNVHAIQMELSQHTYLDMRDDAFAYDADRAALLRPVLKAILDALLAVQPNLDTGTFQHRNSK